MAVVIMVIVDILGDVMVTIELVVDQQVDEGVQNMCVEVAKPVDTSVRTFAMFTRVQLTNQSPCR